jgi:hypothetical protein
MSQRLKIRRALEKGDKLTQKIAISRWKCYRLSGVIFRLREQHYPIATALKKDKTGGMYAEYSL